MVSKEPKATITNREVTKIIVYGLILILVGLTFYILWPIMLSIVFGLILAFMLNPVYKKIYKVFRERNTAALAVCVLLILIVFIPLWFLFPMIISQGSDLFRLIQDIDFRGIIAQITPTLSEQFQQELGSVFVNFVGDISVSAVNAMIGVLLNLPTILLHLAVVIFVFFFTLRDQDKLKAFVAGLSPLKKASGKQLVQQFKDMTHSVVFGVVLVGIIQGIATGIGLIIFGVPQALFLTLVAVLVSIFPLLGPWLVWIPIAVFLFASGEIGSAIGFTLYSAIVVSTLDNFLRPYIVSRKTGTSTLMAFIGMIGGLLVFGIVGIILGPLILAYLVVFLRAYKDKTLSEMFMES